MEPSTMMLPEVSDDTPFEGETGSLKVRGRVLGGIVAEGIFRLSSPAHFGAGESDEVDMTLLRHASGAPYIPGTTLAGVGRATLNARISGWVTARHRNFQEPQVVSSLFGNLDERVSNGHQSALIVDDAELVIEDSGVPLSFQRDGVAIDPKRGVAEDNHKFDLEVLPTGTAFRIRFELIWRDGHQDRAEMRKAFFTLLDEFTGSGWPLRLGAKTNRGYGMGQVETWAVREADFTEAADAVWWLLERNPQEPLKPGSLLEDRRTWLQIRATFQIASSILIGSYPKETYEPDKTPVRNGATGNNSQQEAVVPGTALAGVCRNRALKISRTLATEETLALSVVRTLFGPEPEEMRLRNQQNQFKLPMDSRARFDEALIIGGVEEVQSRIHIDPFTGGVVTGGLFDEQAIWSGETPAEVTFNLSIREPQSAEIGLLLHVLKDLWLEDLPIGGGAAIGRGTLRGISATIQLRHWDTQEQKAIDTIFGFQRETAWSAKTANAYSPRIVGLTPEQSTQMKTYAKALWDTLNKNGTSR